jgi:hypothetical protein
MHAEAALTVRLLLIVYVSNADGREPPEAMDTKEIKTQVGSSSRRQFSDCLGAIRKFLTSNENEPSAFY